MDWRAVTFDWNRARAFLVTAEAGSLSKAAKALGMSQPTLGRQVKALEKELGVALFERGGRGLQLTPNGIEMLEHVRTMAEAANTFSLTAKGRSKSLEGTVRISTSELMAAYGLPPIVRKLRTLHRGIEIDLIASDGISDIRHQEADIALRFYRSGPEELPSIAKKLLTIEGHLYATPDYLASLGHPVTAAGLRHANFIGPQDPALYVKVLNERGMDLSRKNFGVRVESSLVQWELAKHGVGIGMAPEGLGDAEPRVRRVFSDSPPFCAQMWIVVHRELRTSHRVRTVFDFLVKEMRRFRWG